MRVGAFNLFKILVERKEKFEGKIVATQKIDIKDIVKETANKSEDFIRIKFGFYVEYKDLGKVDIEGQVVVLPTKEELEKIIKEWENKKLPDDVKVPLFNFIMNKCNVKALGLEDELGLPPHIQLPKIKPSKD
jgi:hypothetical protein